MYENSSPTDSTVQRRFSAWGANARANTILPVIEMSKILTTLLRRTRPQRIRRPADPTPGFSPRDWADLPVYHPAADETPAR